VDEENQCTSERPRFTGIEAVKTELVAVRVKKFSAVAEMGDRLDTIDMGRKEGYCCAPFRG